MKKTDYLRHILGEEEKKKMRILLDKIESCSRENRVECTDFFDPHEVEMSIGILNRFSDIAYLFSNGLEFGERKVGVLYPAFFSENEILVNDFITALRIEADVELTHSDFLGAILHLGISRDKLGDIFPMARGAYVLATKPIADFIQTHLYRVKHVPVKIVEIALEQVETVEEERREVIFSVTSLRLDLIISSAFHLSRLESARLISSGFVKVQWKNIPSKDFVVSPGMMISVRRHGRIYFEEILGHSSKGKTRIRLSII